MRKLLHHPSVLPALLLSCLAGSSCDGPADEPVGSTRSALGPPIDPRRSLAVTEVAILEGFQLQDVMRQLVAQSGANTTELLLFQQWFETMNEGAPAKVPHCDDQFTGLDPSFNGFPWMCPRAEGVQATQDPFIDPTADEAYVPIGLFNRFDLAPVDGSNCGEYRIVYARRSGITQLFTRNLLIFEAVLPNPDPSCGLEACRPVAQFWADLTAQDDIAKRAEELHRFYFDGLPGFAPVIHVNQYGATISGTGYGRTSGQIRTNSFMQSPWMLREFRLVRDCRSLCDEPADSISPSPIVCRLLMLPATVKTNPFGALFNSTFADARQDAYQAHFQTQVANLAIDDINGFFHDVPDELNAGQSLSQGVENEYRFHMDAPFEADVQATLDELGIDLTPDNIADRATAMACAGCHQLSNGDDLGGGLTWPSSAGFVHVNEFGDVVPGPDGDRWAISPALTDVFLPRRRDVLEAFLAGGGGCLPVSSDPADEDTGVAVPICLASDSSATTADDVKTITEAEDAAGETEKLGGSRSVH